MEFFICVPKDRKSAIQHGNYWVTNMNPNIYPVTDITFAFFRVYLNAEHYIFTVMDKDKFWKLKFMQMFETPEFTVTVMKIVEMK